MSRPQTCGSAAAGRPRPRAARRGAVFGLGALTLLATMAAVGCARWRGRTPLSVVLIVVDTLRADHLGLYGSSRPTSPALDEWAGKGVVFERAHAASSWTLPSFGSIYTGQLPSKHCAGVTLATGAADTPPPQHGSSAVGNRRLFSALDPSVPTLAELLRDHGYETAAIVNNIYLHPMFGIARGFQDYDYMPGSDIDFRPASTIVDRALAWVDAHPRTFFLLIHFMDPHMNYNAPPPFRGRFTNAYESTFSLPVQGVQAIRQHAASMPAADRMFITAAYDEEVAFAAAQIERLLKAFEDRGILRHTLVVLTADHGEELFDHADFGHGHTMYEELLHVPLVIWAPGISPGRLPDPVSLVDITPTVLEAVGLQASGGLSGISLWPAIARRAPVPPQILYAEQTCLGPERKVVIEWPYKLTFTDDGSTPRLSNIVADAQERDDGNGIPSDVRPRLLAQLKRVFPPESETRHGPAVHLDAGTRERLRALGYAD